MAIAGRARAWTLRAVRALHDPAWTADGYVSDRWRPVSPVTGRLDAFQWQTPVAALPSDKGSRDRILAVRGSHARRARAASRRGCQRKPGRKPSRKPSRKSGRAADGRLPARRSRSRSSRLPPPRRTMPRHQRMPSPPLRRRLRRLRRRPNRRRCAGAPVPCPPGHSEDRASAHSGGDSHRPRARRSRNRRGGRARRIRGTNRPGQGARPAAGADFCPAGAADWPAGPSVFLANRAVPDIRCGRFQAVAERASRFWSAAIAQLVEHVIRNDGVTGSNPVLRHQHLAVQPGHIGNRSYLRHG